MQKNKYIFYNISTIFSGEFLQIFSVVSLLIFGYFCSTLDTKSGYFEALPMALTYQQFISLCFLPMLILSAILMIDMLEKSNMLIIRFIDKKKYLIELLKNVVCCNSFLFLIIILVIITFFNFFANGDLTIKYIEIFKTTNIVYTIYIIFKLYILTVFISIIFTLLFKLINKTWALIIAIVIAASLFVCQWFDFGLIDKIYKMPLYFGIYFLDMIEFKTFYLNIFSFFIMAVILSINIFILYKLTIKFMRVVGD